MDFQEDLNLKQDDIHSFKSGRMLRSNKDLILKKKLDELNDSNNTKNPQQGSSNTSFEQGMNNKSLGYISSNIINHSTINNNELSHMKTITIGGNNSGRNRLSLSGIKNSNNLRGNEKPKLNNFMLRRNSQSKDPLLQTFSKASEIKQKDRASLEQSDKTLSFQKKRNVSYQYELTYHEISGDMENVIYIDMEHLQGCKEGDLAEMKSYSSKTRKPNNNLPEVHFAESLISNQELSTSLESGNITKTFLLKNQILNAKRNNDKKIYFIVKPFPPGYNKRSMNPLISFPHDKFSKTFDIPNRSTVYIKLKDKSKDQCELVEIMARDCFVNRGDMWLIRNKIQNTSIHLHERLQFMDSLRFAVTGIYKDGKKFFSGYIGEETKVIIRSESARFFFVIQITEEMWHFQEDGEVLFQKVVNSIFPKILKKWIKIGTNHNISIVFTTSVDITTQDGGSDNDINDKIPGYKSINNKDYYRIVVDEVNISHWKDIMDTLRKEFLEFKKELLNVKSEDGYYHIQGKLSSSVKTNILESINMVATTLLNPFRQIDLRHTTTHVMIISPGAGLFDVNYDLLKLTTKKLLSLEFTIDIVCLASPPMHIVPLFRYIDNDDALRFCVPTWLSISFWNDDSKKYQNWKPTCKIYDLQTLNLTENNINSVLPLKDLPHLGNIKRLDNFTLAYDQNIFKMNDEKLKEELKKTVNYFDLTQKLYHQHRNSSSHSSLKNQNPMTLNNRLSNNNLNIGSKYILHSPTPQKPLLQKVDSSQATFIRNENGTILEDDENISTESKSKEEQRPKYSEAINTLKTVKSNSQAPNIAKRFVNLFNTKGPDTNTDVSSNNEGSLTSLRNSENRFGSKSNNYNKMPRTNSQARNNGKLFGSNFNSGNSSPMFKENKTNEDLLVDSPRSKKTMKFQYDYLVEIENPSKAFDPERADDLISQRWKDVYPKKLSKSTSKWRSFTTPADLPVTTDVCPTPSQYLNNYVLRNYCVSLNNDKKGPKLSTNEFELFRNLVYTRLLAGFQIIENKEKLKKLEDIYFKTTLVTPSTILNDINNFKQKSIYLLGNDEIHRICCDLDSVIEVKQYINKTDRISDFSVPVESTMIKTRYEHEYRRASLDPLNSFRTSINWNKLDQFLAGYTDVDENISGYRIDGNQLSSGSYKFRSKFCVLSTEVPEFAKKLFNKKDELDNEEIRLEGLRKLIAILHKLRYKSDKEKKISRKEEILPEIYFYTGKIQNFIQDQESSLSELINFNNENNDLELVTSKSPDGSVLGLSTNSDLSTIAHEIQHGDRKLNLSTRSWRWISYQETFIGSAFVNWLLKNFDDIETREQAVSFGNYLMENGVIEHVLKTHSFLDGNYYYYIGKSYRNPVSKADQLNNPKSAIVTPLNARKSPPSFSNLLNVKSNKSNTNNLISIDSRFQKTNSEHSEDKSEKLNRSDSTSSTAQNTIEYKKKPIMLSSMLELDLDPMKKSTKPQILTVHFDRVHNPDHCFHIRFEWLTTTPRLVDDLINNLSKTADMYGLKFVELPWEEVVTLNTFNPFYSSVFIKLALNPLFDENFNDPSILERSKYYYHIYFLETSGFLLDNRGSDTFDNNDNIGYEIVYSWGKQTFKNIQFVHKTGAYIAEIIQDGSLFLAPNNIHLSRVNTLTNSSNVESESSGLYVDSQKVMLDFKRTCNDHTKLKNIFQDAKKSWYNNAKLSVVKSNVIS
ncbi:related to Vacuolar membrane-associated protein IML1 [Hanseniaspora guilliermondii]|uniref:Vacuolar membrane-associated protein IML1 n=1 Tax=Hanseniaspora guilliermondii TaxID=56406 RepID=A0A1L0CLS0_9ASCO|nr:related to Vacuolar membrane-associated protein IML1 [Hanseniaspora guilliermondii]